jgi:hypothetical protein
MMIMVVVVVVVVVVMMMMMMMMISVPAYATQCDIRNPIRLYLLSDGGYVSVHLLETKYFKKKIRDIEFNLMHAITYTHWKLTK